MTLQQIISKVLGSGWSFTGRGFSLATDPLTGYAGHYGVDISAKKGTPVPALHDGTVVVAGNAGATGIIPGHPAQTADYDVLKSGLYGWVKGAGNVVVVYSGGTEYVYAHLNAINVKPGDTITAGQMVGTVGDTGDATGPHLHFGMIDWTDKKWLDPTDFLTSLAATGGTFNLLGAFDNAVAFPTGHILTEQDVNTIIAKLDAAHFFQATGGIPGLQQLAENAARDKTRSILMQHVGQAWTPDLEKTLQDQFFGAATAAVTNPVQTLADIAGRLVDPMTYVHTGAFLIGVVLLFVGFRWVVQSGGETGARVG